MSIIKASGTGSVYQVKFIHTDQLKLYSELKCMKEPEKKFILSLLELAHSVAHKYNQFSPNDADPLEKIEISRSDLQNYLQNKDLGAGDTILKKRSSNLTKLGVFRKSKYPLEKRKPADLFILQDITDLIDLPETDDGFKDHRKERYRLKQLRTQLIEADSQLLDSSLTVRVARSERLWNGVFGSCMRTSHKDPRKNEHFSTIYRFGRDQIEIVTSTQTNSEICHVDDQRTIRAIITLACVEIQERKDLNKPITNEFYLDIVDLCDLVGLDGSGANRDTIRESLQRLYSTNFNLKLDSESETGQSFIDAFGLAVGTDDLNFRFLTELDASIDREYGGGAVRRPRWFRIKLHSKTYSDLVNDDVISTFIDNKAILKVGSGLIHIFYTWCSIFIKRNGAIARTITLPELHKQISPSSRYDNFKDRLMAGLIKHWLRCEEDKLRKRAKKTGTRVEDMLQPVWDDTITNKVMLFGYIVNVEPDVAYDFKFNVYRDKKDPIIGDKSVHNRLMESPISSAVQGSLELEAAS